MSDNTLEQLHHKLNRLIHAYEQLTAENQLLQRREQAWGKERARLLEKNELARHRVESMIGHLKTLQENV
ncbi:MAG: TIGR02449 family protein [Cellvibrionaceae bacterium]|nr:TIGR02449 family protein [Cellvibrionaceae bacterium]